MNQDFKAAAFGEGTVHIKFCNESDLTRIFNFYKAFEHQHVNVREFSLIESAVYNNRVFLIEDSNGTIAMASSAYDYEDPRTDSRNISWVEIGSTRAPVEGLGLYPMTIAAQVVHEFLTRPPEEFFFASIYNDNAHVTSFLSQKVGWDIFEPEETLIDVSGERDSMDKLTWLRAGTNTIPHQARLVLSKIESLEENGLFNKKTSQTYSVALQKFSLASSLRPMLEELAYGVFGKQLENRPAYNMREASTAFQKYMQDRPSQDLPQSKLAL